MQSAPIRGGSGRVVDVGYVERLHVRATSPVRLMPHETTHARESDGEGEDHDDRVALKCRSVKLGRRGLRSRLTGSGGVERRPTGRGAFAALRRIAYGAASASRRLTAYRVLNAVCR